MSEADKRHDCMHYAKCAYAYYRQYGLFGLVGNSFQWLIDKPERLTALSTFAIFLATAVAVGVGLAQWRALKGQINEMHSTAAQTDKLIAANVELADAAVQSAQAAKRSIYIAEATQRAWIAATRFSFVNLKDTAEPLKVSVFYQNVGREPARGVKNWLRSGYVRMTSLPPSQWSALPTWTNTTTFEPKEICNRVSEDLTTTVVYPSATFGFSVEATKGSNANFPDSELPILFSEVKEQKTMFFVMGCFSYETLGQRKYSTFCAFLNPITGKDISEWPFSACPVGNDDY